MKIRIDNVLSNDFNHRFKWVDITYKTKAGNKTLELWDDGGRDEPFTIVRDTSTRTEKIPKHFDIPDPYPNQNLKEQPPFIANIPDLNSWCGDPQHVLYDENSKLFYMWSIARYGKGFPSDWFEWTSTDMKSWKFNTIRLQRTRDTNGADENTSIVGGSVIISNGKFAPAGHLLYIVTTQPGWTDDRGVTNPPASEGGTDGTCCYFSEGFGKPIYQRWWIGDARHVGGDYRDSYAFYDGDDMFIAIASGGGSIDPKNDGGIVINKVNSFDFNDWEHNIDFLKAEPNKNGAVNYGVEVPNVIRLNKGRWLVLYSDQYLGDRRPPGTPDKQKNYQSCKGWVCTRVNNKFVKQKFVQLDYGPDAYARRVANPFSTVDATYVLSYAMTHNWAVTNWDTGVSDQDFLKGVVSFDNFNRLWLSDDNFLRGMHTGTVTQRYKGSDFTNPIVKNGMTFLNVEGQLTYKYPPDKKNTWDWVSEDKMIINPDDNIVYYESLPLVQIFNESSGQNMTFLL